MRIVTYVLGALLLLNIAAVARADEPTPVVSGRDVGASTPAFRVFDVTGPNKGQTLCHVCAYKGAPTVLSFFSDTSDATAGLIVKLNELARENADKNLKVVAIITAGPDTSSWLEKLAADKSISIPLSVLPKGAADPAFESYKLNAQAKNTLLVSANKQVSANLTNVTDDSFKQVVDATAKMLAVK